MGATAAAQDAPTLKIGDAAPTLDVDSWVVGQAIDGFDDGDVYVVEFWATWCGPCRQSMPHLAALQKQWRDDGVHIVGVTKETEDVVQDFLAERPDVGYALASDPDESVDASYMQAFGKQGIPTAFIVGRTGHVEWVGHPQRMDAVLEAVVEDRFDRDVFATWQAEHTARQRKLAELRKAEDWDAALDVAEQLVADHTQDEALYGPATSHELVRAQIMLTRGTALDDAYEYADTIIKRRWDEANFLNNLAWFITTEEGLKRRDLDLALTASVRSNLLTHASNAAYLDTLARIYYEQGDLGAAVRYQRDAVRHLEQPHPGIVEVLEKYEKEAADADLDIPPADVTPPSAPAPKPTPRTEKVKET